jgi:guanine deaminase
MKEEDFMREAIKDAKNNKHHFGAIVVKDGKILARAGKRPLGDPRYHAETQAIMKATKSLNSQRLDGCTLYSTCEPCPMCFYMAWITHVKEIVYGATLQDSIKFGFDEIDVGIDELDKKGKNRVKIQKCFLRDEFYTLWFFFKI